MCLEIIYLIYMHKKAWWEDGPGSITGRVIPKTRKIVRAPALLNTQHYKVGIKGKVEQSRERSSALPYTSAL